MVSAQVYRNLMHFANSNSVDPSPTLWPTQSMLIQFPHIPGVRRIKTLRLGRGRWRGRVPSSQGRVLIAIRLNLSRWESETLELGLWEHQQMTMTLKSTHSKIFHGRDAPAPLARELAMPLQLPDSCAVALPPSENH